MGVQVGEKLMDVAGTVLDGTIAVLWFGMHLVQQPCSVRGEYKKGCRLERVVVFSLVI